MGWRGRAFLVDAGTAAVLYDRAGNGLPTAWWDGRIVGGWAQRPDGSVLVQPRIDLPRTAVAALEDQADQLTGWLDGQVLRSAFHQDPQAAVDTGSARR